MSKCILCVISPSLPADPPHPAAVQQVRFPSLSLSGWSFSSHSLKKRKGEKKRPIGLGEGIIAIMTPVALHITQCTDCSTEEEGANTVCSVQTPHNIIIAWLQLIHTLTYIHTHTHSLYLTPFSSLPVIFPLSTKQTYISIVWKSICLHHCLQRECFNCQALGKHTLPVPPPIGNDRKIEWKSSLSQDRNAQLVCVCSWGFGKFDLILVPISSSLFLFPNKKRSQVLLKYTHEHMHCRKI